MKQAAVNQQHILIRESPKAGRIGILTKFEYTVAFGLPLNNFKLPRLTEAAGARDFVRS
jgi:hypothetical protein